MQYVYNKNELSKKVIDFIYGCSMHDAILQQAFKGKKDWVGKVEGAKAPLRDYIDRIIANEFSSQQKHDDFFLKTANQICKEINDKQPSSAVDAFSFGNAQKLINIVIKHTYTFCYYDPQLRENFRYCHCPLDSIMLGKVWKAYGDAFGSKKRKEKLKTPQFFRKSWGDEGQEGLRQPRVDKFPERYLSYQEAIRELIGDGDLYPIEFDYIVWK